MNDQCLRIARHEAPSYETTFCDFSDDDIRSWGIITGPTNSGRTRALLRHATKVATAGGVALVITPDNVSILPAADQYLDDVVVWERERGSAQVGELIREIKAHEATCVLIDDVDVVSQHWRDWSRRLGGRDCCPPLFQACVDYMATVARAINRPVTMIGAARTAGCTWA